VQTNADSDCEKNYKKVLDFKENFLEIDCSKLVKMAWLGRFFYILKTA
jgi:hypothetical protein